MRKNSKPLLLRLAKQMRQQPTPAEREVWKLLRGRRCLGLKFRRQATIAGFIVDFYCPRLRLLLELDGDVHDSGEARARDKERDSILAARGLTILRIANSDAQPETLERLLSPLLPHSPSPPRGEGVRG